MEMGALHLRYQSLHEVARCAGTAYAGELVAVDAILHRADVRVHETFNRRLPPRKGLWRRWLEWMRPPLPVEPVVRSFGISPPPVATDAHTHPLFMRIAGEQPLLELAAGDWVFVVEGVGCSALLRDVPKTRAEVSAAFDRTADLEWAARASVDTLHRVLLDTIRGDVALDELRWRRALDVLGLAERLPVDQLPGLVGVAGNDPDLRGALIGRAARELGRTGDRDALRRTTQALLDRVRFHELTPLLLLLDPTDPEDRPVVEFARIRLSMVLRDEPDRAAELAALASHLGPPT